MNVNELLNKIEELINDCEYKYIGIRTQDGVSFPAKGELFTHISHSFESRDLFGDQDVSDAEELSGASAWELANVYRGILPGAAQTIADCINYYDHVAILASDEAEVGMDNGEIVMSYPTVIEVLA